MAEITPDIRATYGAHVDAIPAEILKAIDQTELLDRLDHARDLMAKSYAAVGYSRTLASGYREQAKIALRARPRDKVEAEANAWLTKAESAITPVHRDACRAEAARIRAAEQAAPRRKRTPAPAPAAAAAPSPRFAYKAEPAAPQDAGDPDAPITREEFAQMVKAELAKALGPMQRREREVQLDKAALDGAAEALRDLARPLRHQQGEDVLYK